jgi:hypothetical protein
VTSSFVQPDQKTTELTEYKSATGLIKRGLDDLARTNRPRPKILRVPIDHPTLELAVAFADEGDTIEILPGTYEENVTIRKGLTIRGVSESAELLPRDEAKPVILVDLRQGDLQIDNLLFSGNTGTFRMPQSGISIVSGNVIVNACKFAGWRESHAYPRDDEQTDWDEYWDHYGGNSGIIAAGTTSSLFVRDCHFTYSQLGIRVIDGARAAIHKSEFEHLVTAIFVKSAYVGSKRNSWRGGQAFMQIQQGAQTRVDSQYDSIVDTWGPLRLSDSPESTVTFSHATICSAWLLEEYVPVLAWPRIVITDSIVCAEFSSDVDYYNSKRIAEGKRPGPDLQDPIEFHGRNLIYGLRGFASIDPLLGNIENGQCVLNAGSPAIGAASDGTNLGAWQGNVE